MLVKAAIVNQTDVVLTSNGATFKCRKESVGEQSDEVDDFKIFCSTVVIDNDVTLSLSHLTKETAGEVSKGL